MEEMRQTYRLPTELVDRLKLEAAKDARSVNKEVLVLLEEALAARKKKGVRNG